ncbi:MAG: pyridoxal phosphate-dependent aminotransferase family protein [Parachlamydia sp.]|jgi:8-amino-7-oxononanoate synthase|nr:pyridoxal phosphate-dependent aminotransferase family protein [Parachlamydia sp.]
MLLKRKDQGSLRALKLTGEGVDFASNDYLGLAQSYALKKRFDNEIKGQRQLGSTGSRLLTGNSAYAERLEESIASFHGFKAGLLFNCGFMANQGVIRALGSSKTVFFADAHVHASTRLGFRLAEGNTFFFRHNNVEHLEKRLAEGKGEKCWICIESIYSTDGSFAPLNEICALAEKYDARVLVDEAHATGVFGREGRGLVNQLGLTDKVHALVITFGKALGTFGAIVLGTPQLKEEMINFSPSLMYSTALPHFCLAAIQCSYALFPGMEKERKHVRQLGSYLGAESPIHFILMPGNKEARQAACQLKQAGLRVLPLLSPTVQKGKEGLRVCLHSFNTIEEVMRLKEFFS